MTEISYKVVHPLFATYYSIPKLRLVKIVPLIS